MVIVMNKLVLFNLIIGIILLTIGLLLCIFYPFNWTQDVNTMSDKEILIVGITDGSLFTGFIMLLSGYWVNKRIKNITLR